MEVKMLAMANKIPVILKEKNWSIYELGKRTELSYNTIHSIVTAEKIPDGTAYGTLKRIARALSVRIDDLED